MLDGDWHHLVGIYEGAELDMLRLYVDGLEVAAGVLDHRPETSLESPWNIGREMCGCPSNTYYGALDELRVYSRALTLDEVTRLYESVILTR